MNKQDLRNSLRDTPEMTIKVSARLHQDVMRAVRLAEPIVKKPTPGWAKPAWGAALVVTVIAVFQFSQTSTPPAPELVKSPDSVPPASLLALGDRLLAISEGSLLPEKELKLELERLKSDLQRFGFKS
jgi:hypothetical protein